MDPAGNERNGLNLPPPVSEQAPAVAGNNEALQAVPEAAPTAAENRPAASSSAMPAMPVLPLPPAPTTGQPGPINDVSNTTQTTVPAVADDGDLIEKEWVNKAKQIVAQTRDNPYQQSKEITLFKADYMKKRYNKTIKLDE